MKKKNHEEQQKAAQNQPVKTGSSEKAMENIDFPPELADFLGETLRGLMAQLGVKPDDPNNGDAFKKYFVKLLKGCDVEKLLHELKCDKAFGLEGDYKGKFYQSAETEEDVPAPEDFTDEQIANIDFSQLDKDVYGNTILFTSELESPEGTKGLITFNIPALPDDPAARACNLIGRIIVPFMDSMDVKEIERRKACGELTPQSKFLTEDHETYYLITDKTYQEFMNVMAECGVPMEEPSHEAELGGRKDGYYEDLCEYWHDGKMYHEKDVIWCELPQLKPGETALWFMANLDHYGKIYSGTDIKKAKKIKVENGRRVLSNEEKFEIMYNHHNVEFFEQLLPCEEVWHLASEYAKTKDSPGYCIVCLGGKFNVPVETFFNYETFELDELIVLFNALPCLVYHHKCASLIAADVGNMQVKTAVRFLKGHVFDWGKRINQDITIYQRQDADFDPFADPYDKGICEDIDDDDDEDE